MTVSDRIQFRELSLRDAELAAVRSVLSPLQRTYPGFDDWFEARINPGLLARTRTVICALEADRPVGVVIAKRSSEAKLCTIWVNPTARSNGLGYALISEAISWIGERRPLVSVPQEQLRGFTTIFRRLDFRLTEQLDGKYRPRRAEYIFNGRL